jgi:hypothetical protein
MSAVSRRADHHGSGTIDFIEKKIVVETLPRRANTLRNCEIIKQAELGNEHQ